jgi:outer membrane protein assembly factor BamB
MALAVMLLRGASTSAGDWPQILGPNRNGIAEEESLADTWPAGGPKSLWSHEVGDGFAGVAVADGKAVVFHRVGGVERVEVLDALTGKPIWKKDYPATFQPAFVEDNGPRATPVIHKDRIYTYGAMGQLRCFELAKGNLVWERDTYEDYNAKKPFRGEPPEGYFGIGSTPLVVDDKLIVNVGGDEMGAGMVAFSLKDGGTLWKSTSERAGYSSPILAKVNDLRHVICITRLSVISLDPGNGDVRFRFPFNGPGPKVSAANPVVLGEELFVTASYNAGAVFAQIQPKEAKVLWQSDDVLSSQYTTPIVVEGKLIGIHGRQDIGEPVLRCIDPKTQQVLWEKDGLGYATLLAADGKLLVVTTEGELILAALDAKAYRELGRARLSNGTLRALPALANGLLYVRDTDTLKCLDLRPQ